MSSTPLREQLRNLVYSPDGKEAVLELFSIIELEQLILSECRKAEKNIVTEMVNQGLLTVEQLQAFLDRIATLQAEEKKI